MLKASVARNGVIHYLTMSAFYPYFIAMKMEKGGVRRTPTFGGEKSYISCIEQICDLLCGSQGWIPTIHWPVQFISIDTIT